MSDEAVMESDESTDTSVATTSETSESSAASAPEVQTAQASAPADATARPQPSVWDAFKALPDFKGSDDVAIARRLYASMEREKAATQALAQYQQYIPYAQQYLQHREPFERWLSSQQQSAQPQQPQQTQQSQQQAAASEAVKKWWNPPDVRESYKQYLVRDENGREVISPEAPLDARHALYEYQKYKADFAQKFLTNPEEALGPMIQERAASIAEQIVQKQFEEVQRNQYVSGLEKENSDWLYDEAGNPTAEGLATNQYIEKLASAGIGTPEQRWEWATIAVERDLLAKLVEQYKSQQQRGAFEAVLPQQTEPAAPVEQPQEVAPNASNQAQKDIEFLRREASRNPSRSAGTADPRTPQAPLTFEQRLAKQLARERIS
jgi:hypothetical protein